jgi:hypothetical protein
MRIQITLNLDDDVAALLHADAQRTGKPFDVVVNEYLCLGLAQRRPICTARDVDLESVDLGGPQTGFTYDKVGELLAATDGRSLAGSTA